MTENTPSSDTAAEALPPDLLEVLVCPLGRAPLKPQGSFLVCTRCGLRYKVEDGIPNMLVEEAELPEGIADLKDVRCGESQQSPESPQTVDS